ncbi:hypothetical protein AAFF_G00347470 [Aldrovandia affinis]|uniref:Uncharacterized protein n=1 Tax=Aldrovandia affinis TaxID=143900 RepID=A0AAD7SJN6_9TELE|nr:hypothetical protein AAFF_G00347470 [Aldrovandia affinis]
MAASSRLQRSKNTLCHTARRATALRQSVRSGLTSPCHRTALTTAAVTPASITVDRTVEHRVTVADIVIRVAVAICEQTLLKDRPTWSADHKSLSS